MNQPSENLPVGVIGTAGHIDHGKTALVRALTGIDTDRLAEEKSRGISIELGFAFMDLPDGRRAGVVDVPGHERFVRTMVAGAHGIDVGLLVVAADDGVMPQTEEHVAVLELLGVRTVVVALTKCDLVGASQLADARAEVDLLLESTRFAGAFGYPVSSLSGEGVEALGLALADAVAVEPVQDDRFFRLPVDRAFQIKGHGTVVTGTSTAGAVRSGDKLFVIPGEHEVRVRSVQVHGQPMDTARAGQRTALNIVGDVDHLRRGCLLSRGLARGTERVDALVCVRAGDRGRIKSHQTVRVHAGTAEVMARLIWLAGERDVESGREAFAQLVLRGPLHLLRGERFVLRNETAQRTVGGGVVVHPLAWRHRVRQDDLATGLQTLAAAATRAEAVRALAAMATRATVDLTDLAAIEGVSVDKVVAAAKEAHLRLLPESENPVSCVTEEKWQALASAVLTFLEEFHRQRPTEVGAAGELVRTQVADSLDARAFRVLLDELSSAGRLGRNGSVWHLREHRVEVDAASARLGEAFLAALKEGGFSPPDIKTLAGAEGVDVARAREVLGLIERDGRVVKVSESLYYAETSVRQVRDRVTEFAREKGEIGAADLRDLLSASRKYSIALLDYFDRTGFTVRVGDMRRLR